MLSDRCLSVCLSVLSCLSVTFVHCGQTVRQIKMKLGMQVGLGPGHIVLDGDPAPLPQRGTAPNFRPVSVAAKWLRGSRCHLVWIGLGPGDFVLIRWGPSTPPPKGGGAPSPISGPFLLWPNGWMHQDATWYGCRPQPRGLCVR